MLRLILNEKRQPLSAHAHLQVPDKERNMLPVKELIGLFPKVARYFDGTSIDRCIATFYKKEGKDTWILEDEDSAEEMKEIFAECGYILDPPEEEEPPVNMALTSEQKDAHKEMIQDIRTGLASAF